MLVAAPTIQPLAYACCCILRQSWRPVPGLRLAATSPAYAGCLPPAYFRSLSPSVESWLVFRLAPDPSSLAQLSRDPESRRMLVLWACGLNPSACAAESLSQACGELSTSTGPCIVGWAADEYPASAVHCTSASPAADFLALAFCLIPWLCQLPWRSNFRWLALFWLGSSISAPTFACVLISLAWLAACLRLSPAACCHSSGNQLTTPYW